MKSNDVEREIAQTDKKKYGEVQFIINDVLKAKGLSKNKVMKYADVQRTQLLKYCNNTVARIDLFVLARICHYLECDISDIMRYIPPDGESDK